VSRRWRKNLQPNATSATNLALPEATAPTHSEEFSTARNWLRYAVFAAILGASFYLAGFTREHFRDADILSNMWRFCGGMFPPDFAKGFLLGLAPLLLQTLAISILGTLIGIVFGGLLALPATSSLVLPQPDSPGAPSFADRGLRWMIFGAARLALNVLRSIPDLVWVLICIVVIGIGPFAGTLAIGLHTAGVLGKLYAETLEEVPRQPLEALRALGAGPFQLLWWGVWPQAKRMLASYTVVRWETNLRVSAILGLVGGGGLGQAIYNNVQLGFYARLGTLLLVIYALVMVSDWIGDTVFRRSVSV
jgi:phosphonate transport system permease protein